MAMGINLSFSLLLVMAACLTSACSSNSCQIEPHIYYAPQERQISSLPSPFSPLDQNELLQDWGKELKIASTFAKEFDFYRAITAYKRALVLIPSQVHLERRIQILYGIAYCYYLGGKYRETIDLFENTELKSVTSSFPAFGEILLILYDSYKKTNQSEKAELILPVIKKGNSEISSKLLLSNALVEADLNDLSQRSVPFFWDYTSQAKSVKKAQVFNALLPGLGYYYVGQKRAAMTSFIINTLFIAAAYSFFENHNVAAGIITLSLESGWYFVGINGAGLAAKEYNERLYEVKAKDHLVKNNLFPILMFNYGF